MRRYACDVAMVVLPFVWLMGCAAGRPSPAASSSAAASSQAKEASSQAHEGSSDCLPERPTPPTSGRQGPGGAPPPPAPVPLNGSRVVAQVVKHVVWAPGTLQNASPPVNPHQVLFSLALSILSSAEEEPGRQNLVVPGTTVEAFSCSTLSLELTGKKIEGILTLTGDTRGVRWWITNIRVLP
jgi:hypothetical protein